jgi:myo-inositol-1-phosphate synthase
MSIELKLEVWDSPNSAGVVIDAVRCAKLALDRRIGGALVGPSSYFMKSPPQQFPDHVARELTLQFIKDAARRTRKRDHSISARSPRDLRADG